MHHTAEAVKRTSRRAAAAEGVRLHLHGKANELIMSLYSRVVVMRNEALNETVVHNQTSVETQSSHEAQVAELINNCADYHMLGTPELSTQSQGASSSSVRSAPGPAEVLIDAETATALRQSAAQELLITDRGRPLLSVEHDIDARRLPSISGWPQHSALSRTLVNLEPKVRTTTTTLLPHRPQRVAVN